MRLKLLSIAFGLAICSSSTVVFSETLKFKSYEPGDHQGIFSNNWKDNSFTSKADYVAATQPDAPLVIYNPGWGGSNKYKPAFKDIREKLGDGYHHIFLSHPDDVDLAGRTVTIYEAIRAVKENGANPSKIIVIGASGGGQEAIHSTHTITAQSLSGGIKIDGVVAFYPSCRVGFEDKTFNTTNVLIFIGAKDKVAPGSLCKELKNAGGLSHATIVEYGAAGHSWLMKDPAKTKKERTWGECRIKIDKAGIWHGKGYDSKNGIGKILKGMGKKCRKKINMTVGRNPDVYKKSINATIDFVRNL